MNPAITTQLVISAVIGETTLPVVLGHFFEHLGPESFLVTVLLLCLTNFVVFLALYRSGTSIVPPTGQPGPMEFLFGALFPGRKEEGSVLMNATENIQVYSKMGGGSSENSIHEAHYGTYESSYGGQH
ncbi:unnamed protein product [Notodromas monacha]|uniref:Uncharacterized protein n=1 Tax=Notodromas monacha TaxID=399045 RepID=A0A7R9BUP8_9CRUS|nr:unnamed protein product [Notodromas monacha]CAG0921009.1 unnamed protein product [Notodromas monacha]